MSVYDRVKLVADKRGLTIKQLSEKIKISTVAIYGWKKTEPKGDALRNTAETLGTTADYLLGLTDDPTLPGQDDMTENQRLIAYSINPDVSDEERAAIIEMVQAAMKFKKRM